MYTSEFFSAKEELKETDPCPIPNLLNDGVCDSAANNVNCDFDGGDCCSGNTAGKAYLILCESCECIDPKNSSVSLAILCFI